LWQNREAAEKMYSPAWKKMIAERYGAPAEIHYYETPVIVDNTQQQAAPRTRGDGSRPSDLQERAPLARIIDVGERAATGLKANPVRLPLSTCELHARISPGHRPLMVGHPPVGRRNGANSGRTRTRAHVNFTTPTPLRSRGGISLSR
jgi:hypothetical protein